MTNFTAEMMHELNLLAMFDLSSMQSGVKIHGTAAPDTIAAAQRLFDKGLLTQPDGGYLTSLGVEAAEHVHTLATVLRGTSG